MWKVGFPTGPSLCTDLKVLMPPHAVEITLTRVVSGVELKSARQISGMPMASSPDRKSIAVFVSAQDEKLAVRKALRRLQDALPIYVLCTIFPGPDGTLKMSIPFAPERACPPSGTMRSRTRVAQATGVMATQRTSRSSPLSVSWEGSSVLGRGAKFVRRNRRHEQQKTGSSQLRAARRAAIAEPGGARRGIPSGRESLVQSTRVPTRLTADARSLLFAAFFAGKGSAARQDPRSPHDRRTRSYGCFAPRLCGRVLQLLRVSGRFPPSCRLQ